MLVYLSQLVELLPATCHCSFMLKLEWQLLNTHGPGKPSKEVGRVVEWKKTHGWIEPDCPIDHPEIVKHQGGSVWAQQRQGRCSETALVHLSQVTSSSMERTPDRGGGGAGVAICSP